MSDNRNHSDPVARAAHLLRRHTDRGWTVMSANILARALRAFRPSAPVRGRHDGGVFFVASDVLVSRLRETVDAGSPAAATRITCRTDPDHELAGVTVQVTAAYGAHLPTLGAHVHAVTVATLTELLGDGPDGGTIRTHVHIGDVSTTPDGSSVQNGPSPT